MGKAHTLVNRSAIKRKVQEKGYRTSTDLLKALDEIVEHQINRAIQQAGNHGKKTLKRNGVAPLIS